MKRVLLVIVFLMLGACMLNAKSNSSEAEKEMAIALQKCEGGSMDACYSLGYTYFKGRGLKQDYKQAANYYAKACTLGHGESCYDLGVIYDEGLGTSKDSKKAMEFYTKSCLAGSAMACSKPQIALP